MNVYLPIKRFIDLFLSIILIIILSPLFLIIALLIKIDSPGPILYKQLRTGKNEDDFTVFKFRSMSASNDVYDFSTEDKITKVGRVIRKTSLDELPQLFNIIKGDMSFIGPRPWVPVLNNYYTSDQKKRFQVRPGLTGLAQVSGRKDLNIIDRIAYDIKYVENISFINDVKIFLKTILVIIKNSDNTRDNYTLEDEINDLENYYNECFMKEN